MSQKIHRGKFNQKLQTKLESLISDTKKSSLEGIREKVFLDRYSLKDAEGNALEKFPEQTWRRVAAGIAQVEKTKEKQREWTTKFYDIMKDFKFVPGGRVISGAGTPF